MERGESSLQMHWSNNNGHHYLDPASSDRHAFLYKQIHNDIIRRMHEVETRAPLTTFPNRRSLSQPEVKHAARPKLAQQRTPTTIRIRKLHHLQREQHQQQIRNPKPRIIDWTALPSAVLDRILVHVRALHLNRLGNGCDTCYARDLASVQRVCRAWNLVAQKRLYERIVLVGADDHAKLTRYRIPRGARIYLLRRTLRIRPALAEVVREIHVEDPLVPAYLPDDTPNRAYSEFRDLVASLVICCPNLERLTGFYSSYIHEFDLLTHALSQRSYLKEHVWIIGENEEVTARSVVQLSPGLLTQAQTNQFWSCHRQWTLLETLMLCSPGSLGVIEHDLFAQVFQSLPSLKRLCVSSFDADDFTDQTLLATPALEDLRLEECAGVTEGGLTRWAASLTGSKIRRLSLVHQNITALLTLSKMLTFLTSLEKFTLIQTDVVPSLPLELIVFQPVMASSSLRGLHWDVGESLDEEMYNLDIQSPRTQTASQIKTRHTPNVHLALSILHGGFPKLERLRAPRDLSPRGALQSVCQPAHVFDLTSAVYYHSHTKLSANNLLAARIRAQEIALSKPKTQDEYTTIKLSRSDLKREDTDTSNSTSSQTTTSTDATDPSDLFQSRQPTSNNQHWDLNSFARNVLTTQTTTTVDSNGTNITHSGPLRSTTTTTTRIHPAHTTTSTILRRYDSVCRCPPHLHKRNSVCQCEQPLPPTRPIPPPSSHLDQPHPAPHPSFHQQSTSHSMPAVPTRSHLRPAPIVPLRIHEFSLPSFIGRVAMTTSQAHIHVPPIFDLNPDVCGRDTNGGVIGWGDLLRIGEKARVTGELGHGKGGRKRIKDGCVGAWNQESPGEDGRRGSNWWRHVERERRRDGEEINVGLFF